MHTNKRRSSASAWVLFGLIIATGSLLTRDANGQVRESSARTPTKLSATGPSAVLAGGCFWGVDAVFKHVKGVTSVISGYAGGTRESAQYETVSTGTTGHAESVKITYDPSRISYLELLKIFFFVAHNPTELNRQGPDEGTQYRSVIFYESAEQQNIAKSYIKQLNHDKAFTAPIVTQVVPLKGFYPAEEYHQNYLERNPENPYIVFNDMPKLDQLRKQFPAFYTP
ncbi:MAG: peptide-methionine (S)-S-oxide reductase MsrA [Candidatus Binataceae bacterium]|jgi:peptide-methionine (S)-S-oxide reductase